MSFNNAGANNAVPCIPRIVICGEALETLDDQSLESLIAHECGHIQGNHNLLMFLIENQPFLKKLFYEGGGYGYIQRACEKFADNAAISIVGPEAFIRHELASLIVADINDSYSSSDDDSDDDDLFSEKGLEKAEVLLRKALKEGFCQKEDSDTLMNSIRIANNDSHPSSYERIVAAARIWAKNLADAKVHAKAD
jgi:Zn-dependent protease with chaperone function